MASFFLHPPPQTAEGGRCHLFCRLSDARSRIAEKSVDCCRKRYDRAEREFIEAKTDLHSKSEAKDLLTEHLYTVIHQNELRKARKLAELTHKLELEPVDDDVVVDAAETVPVPLCLVMPINQLTSHGPPTSPSSSTASRHTEQSPEVASNNQQTAEPQCVPSDTGHETALSSPPQTEADIRDTVNTVDSTSNSAVASATLTGAAAE